MPRSTRLPGKFGFLLDDGGARQPARRPRRCPLRRRLRCDDGAVRFAIALGGTDADASPVGLCRPDDVAEAARASRAPSSQLRGRRRCAAPDARAAGPGGSRRAGRSGWPVLVRWPCQARAATRSGSCPRRTRLASASCPARRRRRRAVRALVGRRSRPAGGSPPTRGQWRTAADAVARRSCCPASTPSRRGAARRLGRPLRSDPATRALPSPPAPARRPARNGTTSDPRRRARAGGLAREIAPGGVTVCTSRAAPRAARTGSRRPSRSSAATGSTISSATAARRTSPRVAGLSIARGRETALAASASSSQGHGQ